MNAWIRRGFSESLWKGEDMNNSIRMLQQGRAAFTFIELVVVMVILGIAAMLAVPMFSSAADSQLQAAAALIAADLDYAKNLAITRQMTVTAVFDPGAESYQVQDSGGTVLSHPTKVGASFRMNFASDNRTSQVDITAASFDGNSSITFDYLGSPYSGTTTATAMTSGQIALSAGTYSTTVTVEPVTGYIRIP
jgi:prepilin-type N-terminal cleavage/methylation domain-containing protein